MFHDALTYEPHATTKIQTPSIALCQKDYPLDWYTEALIPYAEAYQALPDRKLDTVFRWMKPYVQQAQKHFGPSLMMLAHYYMGGEIVQLIDAFGGIVGDSYQLACLAMRRPEASVIVESAVHFMAESIALLAHPHQKVYITNPKSGCTMEMLAKDYMVEPALVELTERYGTDNILPICYMNTSGRVKAMTGAQNGIVCTSSNVLKITQWALQQHKKILFIPDQHMAENVAHWTGVQKLAYWPSGTEGAQYQLANQPQATRQQFDDAQMIIFKSHCAVHSFYQPHWCEAWHAEGYTSVVHPECPLTVTKAAHAHGSTAFIWDYVLNDRANTKRYAIGTEHNMVRYLQKKAAQQGISVVNLADTPPNHDLKRPAQSCGCATMSRNDPPHLVGVLDLLRQGHTLDYHEVQPGDRIVDFTGSQYRLNQQDQQWIREHAQQALRRMINITEQNRTEHG